MDLDLDRLRLAARRYSVKRIIDNQPEIFGPWVMASIGGVWTPRRGTTIGLWDDEKGRRAGAVYCDYDTRSIVMHFASDGTKAWLTRQFLWFVFYYPFIQLSVHKIICPVASDNLPCRKFIEHIGFTPEATLKDATPKGDLILYTMTRDQCRWLNLRNLYRGQAEGTESA